MNPAAAWHPSPADLSQFATGQLSVPAAADIEEHVSNCPECCAALRAVADDAFTLLVRQATAAPLAARLGDTMPQCASPWNGENRADSTAPEIGPGPPAAMDVPEVLREHPRYRVLELLGQGGMGTVFKAEHRLMKRTVALKLLARNLTKRPEVTERFVRETQTAARLTHPNIAQAFDAEQAGDLLFLVMEFIPGADLARLVQGRGPLPSTEACNHIRQAALALQHAHEHGMVHRDIKPHNLMLTPAGEIKVLDFGLARFVLEQPLEETAQAAEEGRAGSSHLTEEGLFMGTADYVAPEQARNAHQADIRADIYALGCTLYHLLTGQVPFPAGTVKDKVLQHATRQPPSLSSLRPDLPPGLEAVVQKMMAMQPSQRYQTPGEVAAALAPFATKALPQDQPIASGVPVEAKLAIAAAADTGRTAILSSALGQSDQGRWRRRLFAFAAGVLLVAMALAGVAVYRIQTDTGEIVIRTTDDEVEVVVSQGGKVVKIHDPKTKQKLVLHSGTYELELKGKTAGLKLDLESATLKRGDVVVATIMRQTSSEPGRPKVGELWSFDGHVGPVLGVDFSPDGKKVLSCSGDGSVRLFDALTGKQLRAMHHRTPRSVAFLPDGKRAISTGDGGDHRVYLWDLETRNLLAVHGPFPHPVYGVAITADGKRALVGITLDESMRLLEIESGKEIRRFDCAQQVHALALSPDGKRCLSAGPGSGIIILWDNETGKELKQLGSPQGQLHCVAIAPDGKHAVAGGDDKLITLWDLDTGKEIRKLIGHTALIHGVAFSRDGRFVASASYDGTIRLWDAETGKELHKFEVHKAGVYCVAFSPDGRLLVSGGSDFQVRVWRLPEPPPGKDAP